MNLKLPVAIIFLFLGASCTIYKEYPIEVYQPEEIAVPLEAKSAAVLYRNFRYTSDTLQHFFKTDGQLIKAKNDHSNSDSLQAVTCLNELALHLKNNNVFDEVAVLPYAAFEKHSGDQITPLPSELIRQLASDAVADVLISLETYSSFYSGWTRTADDPPASEVVTVAVWGIYDGATGNPAGNRTMIDTIYWNGYDDEGNLLQNYRLPPRTDALVMASAMAGVSFAEKFYPGWQTVNRMYSIPPLPDFSEAALFFEDGKWDEAIMIWTRYADNRNGKMAINARYNLALASEMKDDLDLADKWLSSAMELAISYRSKQDQNMIKTYQKILAERQKDIRKISSTDGNLNP
jgi:tetratricopeptide (TPR) repeat protein